METMPVIPALSAPKGSFKFKIANGTGADKRVALFTALFDVINHTQITDSPYTVTFNHQKTSEITTAGFDVDAILDDGVIDATSNDLVGTCLTPNHTIRLFQEYIKHNTLMAQQLIVECDNVAGFTKDLEISRVSPPQKLGTTILSLTDYLSTAQNIDTKVIIKEKLELSDESLWILDVPNGRTYTFTLKF